MRPDRLGIVVDDQVDLVRIGGVEHPCAQIWVAPGHEDDCHRPGSDAQAVIRSLLAKKLAVLWRMADNMAVCFYADAGAVSCSAPTKADRDMGTDAVRMARAADLVRGL